MQNIVELRSKLIEVFNDIKTGEINHVQAKEMNNSAGKIINTLKTQIEYSSLRKERPSISFLDDKK